MDFVSETSKVYECVADGTHTFNLETWMNTKQEQRNKWVNVERLVAESPVGYNGKEGIFLAHIHEAEAQTIFPFREFLQHWKAYKFEEVLKILPFDKSTILDQPFLCKNSTQLCFDGRFVPPQCCVSADEGCEVESTNCRELLHPSPNWASGWFEAVITNLGLNLTVAYVGTSGSAMEQAIMNHGGSKPTLFYWFSPDPLLTKVSGGMVGFPDYSADCADLHSANIMESGVNCGSDPSIPLQIIYPTNLHKGDIQLKDFLQRVSIPTAEVDHMLSTIRGGGGHFSINDGACAWVKENFQAGANWSSWVLGSINGGNKHKKDCEGGQSSGRGPHKTCRLCEMGSFKAKDQNPQSSCSVCPLQYFTATAGSIQCQHCDDVTKLSEQCDLCRKGTYTQLNSSFTERCVECPVGYFQGEWAPSAVISPDPYIH
jgi:ABC-type proline/glycine betaine transport system substrate-binding protein